MFKVSPLLNLTDFDEEEFKRGAIRQHPPIQGPNGQYFGHEWSRWRRDSFDEAVDRWLAGQGRECAVLDVGGASGVRAAEFTDAGHRTTVVDLVDFPAWEAMPAIAILRADLRTLRPSQVASPLDLIHARRVLNFLSLDELDRFLAFSRESLSPDGRLAFSLFTLDVEPARLQERSRPGGRPPLPLAPGLLAHHLSEVHALMSARDLRIVEAFSDQRAEVGVIAGRFDAINDEIRG